MTLVSAEFDEMFKFSCSVNDQAGLHCRQM